MNDEKAVSTGLIGVVSEDPGQVNRKLSRIKALLGIIDKDFSILTGDFFAFCFFPATAEAVSFPVSLTLGSLLSDDLKAFSAHGLKIAFDSERSFTLTTDPVGMLNLYRIVVDDILLLSTSSLLLAAIVPALEFDERGWMDFLTIGYLSGSRTFYQGMDVLPGGVEISFANGNLPNGNERIYWQTPRERISGRQAITALKESSLAAAEAVSSFSHSCCDLTGGYDSRGIFAMFLGSGHSFDTVVNGISGSGDVVVAEEIAQAFAIPLHHNDTTRIFPPDRYDEVVKIIELTDGEIDVGEYYLPATVHQRTLALGMTTVNGSGGELFRGYWWEGQAREEYGDNKINLDFLVSRILVPGQDFSIYRIPRREIELALAHQLRQIVDAADFDGGALRQIDWLYLRLRMSRWAARFYSSTVKIIPCFSPYLFAPLLEIAFSVESHEKMKNRFFIEWLKEMNPKLARLPLESGRPAIPFSLQNMFLFRRMPKKFAGKVAGKLFRILTSRVQLPGGGAGEGPSPFIETVLNHYGANEFFSRGEMVTGALYDEGRLEKLAVSRIGELEKSIPGGQLSRLFTLEVTMRHLLDLRKKIAEFS